MCVGGGGIMETSHLHLNVLGSVKFDSIHSVDLLRFSKCVSKFFCRNH